ncbi:MAG TPA: glycosyltransferase family 39 protein [Candidatus Kryptonia bacterium]|nr:glycosyltransferase family 39 protein [Candidatus Kryptonia bacterium]
MSQTSRADSTPIAGWEWSTLALIGAAALALRLYALGRIPAVFFHDECDNLVNVYQILNGNGPGFFGLDWKPQPAASVYLLSLFMRVGKSVFALRLPAALMSVAAVVPFYLLLRRAVAAVPALLTTLLLATDIWYLHFSRSGWDNIFTCLFVTAAALSVDDAVHTGRARCFGWAGVWSTLGAYGYAAGRTILPAILLILLCAGWRPLIPRRRLLTGALLTTAVTVILFIPQVRSIRSNWEHFQDRPRFVSVLKDQQNRSVLGKVAVVLGNFGWKAPQLFTNRIPQPAVPERPSRYLRVDDGAFLRPTAIALLVGMVISFFMLGRDGPVWQWWIFLLTSFGITEALTFGSLNGARGIIFVPLLYLFVGLTVDALWQLSLRTYRPLAALLVAATMVLSVSATRQYFVWVQSSGLLEALEPAIPIDEFPAWQAYVLDWTAHTSDFFNVNMWKEYRKSHPIGSAGAS